MAKKVDGSLIAEVENVVDEENNIKQHDIKSPPVSFRTRSGRNTIQKNYAHEAEGDAGEFEETGSQSENEENNSDVDEEYKLKKEGGDSNRTAENDIANLTNEELGNRLKDLGFQIGPIVGSTRKIYEKRLRAKMEEKLEYSTDEDGAAESPVVEEKIETTKVRTTRTSRSKKTNAQAPAMEQAAESFSDDEEEEAPIVKNSSSRRRSARIAKKIDEDVEPMPEITENNDEVVEEEEEIIEENESIEVSTNIEPEIATESDTEPEPQQKSPTPFPIHTVLLGVLLAVIVGFIFKERTQLLSLLETAMTWLDAKYNSFFLSLMPDIETIEPAAAPTDE